MQIPLNKASRPLDTGYVIAFSSELSSSEIERSNANDPILLNNK